MTALAGVELESLVSEPDALTTRPLSMNQPLLRSIVLVSKRLVCALKSLKIVILV